MQLKDFFELYAKKIEATNLEEAEKTCRSVINVLQECLEGMEPGERLNFYGFGTFVKQRMPVHKFYNFQTKEIETRQPIDIIKFSQSRTSN